MNTAELLVLNYQNIIHIFKQMHKLKIYKTKRKLKYSIIREYINNRYNRWWYSI